jgi:hypothetical protein
MEYSKTEEGSAVPPHEYVWALLLLMPGFLCHTIHARLNHGRKEQDGLRLILSTLYYNSWVLAFNGVILYFCFGIRSLTQLTAEFDRLDFVLIYAGLTLISSYLAPLLFNRLETLSTLDLVNLLRSLRGKPAVTNQPFMEILLGTKCNHPKSHVIKSSNSEIILSMD